MPTLAAQLLPEMFTLPQVAMAFEAYLNIYNRGESADALSVEKELRRIAPDKETLATDLYQLALGRTVSGNQRRVHATHARHLREGLRGEAVHAELLRLGLESLTAGP